MKRDYLEIAKKVKEIVLSIDPNARIYIFGSVVRGTSTAASDIDILIVTKIIDQKYEIMVNVYKNVDENVELHVVTEEDLERWYKRFIPNEELIEV
ncbi:MAG: nucleotidyltransferase domain-containing protein [Candidatus Methanomethyliaceae archaeon]|nr:nucleotidyltransferase domain-containing protein [Candidatus Methanomethyliaceae archaeon]MDW7970645.1 nucleotidyltransferase domain-containing protein [Nitrososphaerota archaeon]